MQRRPCLVNRSIAPGGVPGPNSADGRPGPETGLIVKYDGQAWRDSLGRSWNGQVRFTLPDSDLFAIDALAATPRVVRSWAHVGTVLYNLRANPKTGTLYVSNTEASNHIRFEGARPAGSVHTTVQGRAHQSRITVIDGDGVLPRHLNKHIDYRQRVAPPAVREKSLALPTGMAISDDGRTLYLAAFGSAKVGVFDTRELETDRFVPDRASQIELLAGGPSGLVLDEARGRLYVLTRFNNAVAVVDIASRKQIASHAMPNPEPASVVAGRRFLYDARYTSSNGEQACASCHVFGDTDSLGWDLGNPLGGMLNHPGEFRLGPIGNPDFHPLKGPMTTQSLRGLADSGSMHWRGDRTGGNDAPNVRPDGGSYDERAAFEQFNAAFVALLGRENALSDAEMRQFTDFALRIVYPPNPIRKLDNTLTPRQKQGEFLYFNALAEPVLNCNGCHQLDRAKNHFGTDGRFATQLLPQHLKVPHLRNVYQKVGMFGVANLANIAINDGGHKGEQIRGFGMLHDGALDTVFRHLHRNTFVPLGADGRRALEQFVFAYDSNLYPAVGQQVVLAPEYDAEDEARLALLEAQAAAGRCDLVVHGLVDGRPRGYLYGGDGLYRGDRCGEPAQTSAALRPWGPADGAMTFTCVPPGSGVRIALDRDRDGVLDGDDNCVASANADQADSNHDGVGDLCQDAPVGPPVLGAGAHCDATPGAPVATDERAPSLMDRLLPVLQFGNDLSFGTLLGLLGLNG